MGAVTPILEANGWTLLGGYETKIGRLNEFIDLWDIGPTADGAAQAIAASLAVPGFVDLVAKLEPIVFTEDTTYLDPVPYSPREYLREHSKTVYLVRTQCHYFKTQRFFDVMTNVAPALEQAGLRLLGGYETRIGRLSELWHFWEPRLDESGKPTSLEDILLAAHDSTPELVAWLTNLEPLVADYEIRSMESVPFAH
jgi:hypothetical protein